jgi:hypothetical protein
MFGSVKDHHLGDIIFSQTRRTLSLMILDLPETCDRIKKNVTFIRMRVLAWLLEHNHFLKGVSSIELFVLLVHVKDTSLAKTVTFMVWIYFVSEKVNERHVTGHLSTVKANSQCYFQHRIATIKWRHDK